MKLPQPLPNGQQIRIKRTRAFVSLFRPYLTDSNARNKPISTQYDCLILLRGQQHREIRLMGHMIANEEKISAIFDKIIY